MIDRLSLGANFGLSGGSATGTSTVISVGPSATYYFLQANHLAPFIKGRLNWNSTQIDNSYLDLSSFNFVPSTESLDYWSTTIQLGVNYFFNPSIAFGPAFEWTHAFSSTAGSGNSSITFSGYDNLALAAVFSMYL